MPILTRVHIVYIRPAFATFLEDRARRILNNLRIFNADTRFDSPRLHSIKLFVIKFPTALRYWRRGKWNCLRFQFICVCLLPYHFPLMSGRFVRPRNGYNLESCSGRWETGVIFPVNGNESISEFGCRSWCLEIRACNYGCQDSAGIGPG